MATLWQMMVVHRGMAGMEPDPRIPTIWRVYRHDHSLACLVFILFQEKLNVEALKTVLEQAETLNSRHLVIIYSSVVTSSVKKTLAAMKDLKTELFSRKELQFDITQHYLYCPHRLLSKEEASCVAKEYGNLSMLPKLLRTDPVCRYMDFHKDQVIAVTRKDGSTVHRVVR